MIGYILGSGIKERGAELTAKFVNQMRSKIRPNAYGFADSILINTGFNSYEQAIPGSGCRYDRSAIDVAAAITGAFRRSTRFGYNGASMENIRDVQLVNSAGYPPGIAFFCVTHNDGVELTRGWSQSAAGVALFKSIAKQIISGMYAQGHAVVLVHLGQRHDPYNTDANIARDMVALEAILPELAEECGCMGVLDVQNSTFWKDINGSPRAGSGLWVATSGDTVHPTGQGINASGQEMARQWIFESKLPVNKTLPAALGAATAPNIQDLLDGDGVFVSHTGAVPTGWTSRLTASTYNAAVAPAQRADGSMNAVGHWCHWTTPAASTGMYQNLSPTPESGDTNDSDGNQLVRIVGRIKGGADAESAAIRSLKIEFASGWDCWAVNGLPFFTPPWETLADYDGLIIDQFYYTGASETNGQMRFDITGSSVLDIYFADLQVINYGRANLTAGYPITQMLAAIA